ncbi:MAG: glycine cleavage system protein H [Deltaproteobacteria bacterium]|nr:glycine cleavage system protein H [Deltaproteobacteria bacterium]
MVVLLVLLTVLCFITVELAIRWSNKRRAAESGILDPAALFPASFRPAYEMPGGLFIHNGHTWARLEASGEVKVGLDGFAREIIGRVDRFELPAKGKLVRQGEPAFAVLQDGKRIELVAPVDGEVCAVNEILNADAVGSMERPYEKGWAFAIRPTNLGANMKKLRVGVEASVWLGKEVRRFTEFLTLYRAVPQEVGVTMPDGGVHTEGVMETMDGEILQIAVRKFFR